MNIYVGNLDLQMKEDSLEKLFSIFGEIEKITIVRNKLEGRSKGYGFVLMPNAIEAERAINELNSIDIAGRLLIVREAQIKNETLQVERTPRIDFVKKEKYHQDYDGAISFKMPKEQIKDKASYSTTTDEGFIKIKFKD